MKKVIAVGALALLATSGAQADSYNFSGTFDSWLALSPGSSTDSNSDGTQDCTGGSPCVGVFSGSSSLGTVAAAPSADVSANGGFNVTGSITFAGAGTTGSVTALTINQVGTANSPVNGNVTLTTTGMSWAWASTGGFGGDRLTQTGGTATCTGTNPSDSGCVNTAPAITQNADSVWNWDGINAAMRVQGGAIDPVDTEAFDHSVSGNTVTVSTSSRTLYQNSNLGLFNTASAGQYTLNLDIPVIPVPAAVWLMGSALGLMGVMRRRKAS